MCDYCRGHAADQVPHQTTVAVGANHDQARMAVLGSLDDPLPRGLGLDRHPLCPEACLLCE